MVLPRAGCPDLLGRVPAEQIRRHEVSRVLEKMNLSPEEEEAVERLSYSLVAKILLGPISEAIAGPKIRILPRGQGVDRVVSMSEARPER
jgi:hypothetical protein